MDDSILVVVVIAVIVVIWQLTDLLVYVVTNLI